MSFIGQILTIIAAGIVSAVITKFLIPFLKKKAGQNIREEGPESHQSKAGTPSMGGIAIIIAATVCAFAGVLFASGKSATVLMIIFVFLGFGLIGFIDDYLKVIKKQNEGLKAYQKFGLQLVISIIFVAFLILHSGRTYLYIPILGVGANLGWFYGIFEVFVVLAMTNAVNLTDGLDGLASGVTALVTATFAFMAGVMSLLPESYFCAALCGACLGFLVFNKNPAKVFMGDTGSLALGGGIAAAVIAMHMELMIIVVGLLYVIEALSVVLQVGYFKATHGKRLFKMAPIHHHFEKCGYTEKQVVTGFWIFTFACCILGIIIFYI